MKLGTLKKLSYIYLVAPIILFILGFVKLYISIPLSIGLVFAMYKINKKTDSKNKIDKKIIFILLFISLFICFLAGHGCFFSQNPDYHARNAIFRDLINYKWPVIYTKTNCSLSYYIGQWIVPALFGKMFLPISHSLAWTMGNIMLLIWNSLGVFLSLMWLTHLLKINTKKKAVIASLIFLLFSGLDVVGLITLNKTVGSHLEWWATFFQFSSMTTQLFWVFNQAIVPWLIILMFFDEDGVQNYGFLGMISLAYGPLPFLGIVVIFISKGIKYFIDAKKNKEINKYFKELFSIQNIIACLCILPVYYFYYSANAATSGDGGFRLMTEYIDIHILKRFVLFYILEIGVYLVLLYKEHKNDYLYYVVGISLIIIPFFQIGQALDFCMRVSIPFIVIIDYWCIKYLMNDKKRTIQWNILLVVLVLGMVTSYTEISRGVDIYKNNIKLHTGYLYDDWKTLGNKNPKEYQNFLVKNYKKTNYYKYLSK